VTHASFVVPGLDGATALGLARDGAHLEVTAFQLLHQAGLSAAALAAFIREVGPERCILSSDAGQPDSPAPPEALRTLVAALTAEGLDDETVDAMASRIPESLVAP
jgi:predicted metal-dependent TIM-barrel fold hydrolase